MTAVILATACAIVYGTADFCGGLATRRSRVLSVVALSQIAGFALVLAMMPVLPGVASEAERQAWCCSTGRWPPA
jgi:hypothetical protein